VGDHQRADARPADLSLHGEILIKQVITKKVLWKLDQLGDFAEIQVGLEILDVALLALDASKNVRHRKSSLYAKSLRPGFVLLHDLGCSFLVLPLFLPICFVPPQTHPSELPPPPGATPKQTAPL